MRLSSRAGPLIIAIVAFGSLVLPASAMAQTGLGFRYAMGWQDVSGDYGTIFDGATDADFTILYGLSKVRLGGGANFVSFAMDDVNDETWSQITGHFLVAYPFQIVPSVGAYVEGRMVFRRLRPEGTRYSHEGEEEILSDFVVSASGFEGVAGLEVPLDPRWAFEVSASFSRFTTDMDVSSQGLGPIDSGGTWRVHAGITWFPTSQGGWR